MINPSGHLYKLREESVKCVFSINKSKIFMWGFEEL